MIDLKNKGLSCEEIGKRLNIGTVTVWNHLKGNRNEKYISCR